MKYEKKLLFLILPVLLCIFIFVGCQTTTGLVFSSAKWQNEEQLVYNVTSIEDGSNSNVPVIVGNGTYTSTIKETTFDGKEAFEVTTDFTFTGKYVAKEFTGNEFTDTITTKCVFFNHQFNYLPITSERIASITEIKMNSEGKYITSRLEYKTASESTFDYDNNSLTRIDSTLFGKNSETGAFDVPLKIVNGEKELEKQTNYTYKKPAENKAFFDNEQLFYGIRCLISPNLTGQAISLNTVFDSQITKLYLNKSKDEKEGVNKETGFVSVSIGGTSYSCSLYTLSGDKNVSGIPIKLYYEDEFGYKENDIAYKRNLLVKMIQGNLAFELSEMPAYEKL